MIISRCLLVIGLLLAVVICATKQATAILEQKDCPVCFSTIEQLMDKFKDKPKPDIEQTTQAFLDFCKQAKKGTSENTFCYYMGGQEVSATRTYKDMAKYLSWGWPIEKVCSELKLRDSQICEIRQKIPIDIHTVDLKTLKVAALKRVLKEKDIVCEGCVEKSEFIAKIEEIKAKERSTKKADDEL